jgi:hypothetical protein
MSTRENIQIYYPLDIEKYLEILKQEYGAEEHPAQPGAYLLEGLPFYLPQRAKEYVFILGFNQAPLSGTLMVALAEHPDLAPGETFVQWTDEQELVIEGKLKEFYKR